MKTLTTNPTPTVYIVEDDQNLRESTAAIVESWGMKCKAFADSEQYLQEPNKSRPGCLLLDHILGKSNGHALQKEMQKQKDTIPIIVLTAHSNVSMAVNYLENGALTLIEKPYDQMELRQAIQRAVAFDIERLELLEQFNKLYSFEKSLSERERNVLQLVIDGELNKNIAKKLDVSQRTIENIRARILSKFSASTAAELAAMATELKILSKVFFRYDSTNSTCFRNSLTNHIGQNLNLQQTYSH